MDAANLFKPMLARGQLRCIGATTLEEYRKYVEKDAAFERRFQQVCIIIILYEYNVCLCYIVVQVHNVKCLGPFV